MTATKTLGQRRQDTRAALLGVLAPRTHANSENPAAPLLVVPDWEEIHVQYAKYTVEAALGFKHGLFVPKRIYDNCRTPRLTVVYECLDGRICTSFRRNIFEMDMFSTDYGESYFGDKREAGWLIPGHFWAKLPDPAADPED